MRIVISCESSPPQHLRQQRQFNSTGVNSNSRASREGAWSARPAHPTATKLEIQLGGKLNERGNGGESPFHAR
jgi:hypothetical protein